MQNQGNIFLRVASQIPSAALLTEILQSQLNTYEIQSQKIEASDGSTMAKVYQTIKKRYERAATKDSDPDSWNENQRRLFIWFVVCYSYLLEKEEGQITAETWTELSPYFFDKKPEFLHFQYLNLLKNKSRVGWSTEEDRLLAKCTQELSPGKWNAISKKMFYESMQQVFKTPKSCRERWFNHLDQSKKKGNWSNREDLMIFRYANQKGKRWSKMVDLLEGTRTEHMIKNRYNSLIAKWKGAKKQKQEDVARNILNMLTTTLQGTSAKKQESQQRNNSLPQDKNIKDQCSPQIRHLPPSQQAQLSPSQPGQLPVRPSQLFPYCMDYHSFLFYQHCCYQQLGYPPVGMGGMLQPSKQSNFSSYKEKEGQKAEDLN